jgi:hypothetical protein
VAAWCEAVQLKPSAHKPSADEQEQQAADELERMMRAEWLDEQGIGGRHPQKCTAVCSRFELMWGCMCSYALSAAVAPMCSSTDGERGMLWP